jgi:2-haloacid dehalogenase
LTYLAQWWIGTRRLRAKASALAKPKVFKWIGARLPKPGAVAINRPWIGRLRAWPDVLPGLRRLRRPYIVAALSNGNLGMLTRIARYAGIKWDCVLSAELSHHYKPDPEFYMTAIQLLNLKPQEVMMVAAHKYDLKAAKAMGMRTAFVKRPLEYGPQGKPDMTPEPYIDVMAEDFVRLAEVLGC